MADLSAHQSVNRRWRRLVLVRHGETVGNSSIRYYGRTDVPLSDLGQQQMRAAGRWLRAAFKQQVLGPVFTSPLRRATESALLIAGPDATASPIAEFIEVDFGLFEGLTAEEINERYPAEFQRWRRYWRAADYTYPGGENRAAFEARVIRGTERMLSMLDAVAGLPHAVLVAHRGVIRTITQHLCGVTPHIEIGSIQALRWDFVNHSWEADLLDVTEHL